MHSSDNSNSSQRNRLVGWLVSYESDQLGSAHEIRAGRTLLSSENAGKSRSITLQTKGVSAPHLALSASAKHTILVQDIFSDEGSFLTRANSTEEKPIRGATEIKHGDWLRIGAKVRFQVCLIDAPSR